MAGPLKRAESYTIILGSNEIGYCDAALVVEGEEVFRVREEENGQLLVERDIKNEKGEQARRAVGSGSRRDRAGSRPNRTDGSPEN
jgi:hypothetical protein